MKFCSSCGSHLVEKIPRDDDRRRHVCPGCDTVHYQNPKIVTGCLPVWEEARAHVEIQAPYSMFNLPHVNQLYVIYRARLKNLDFRPGPESEDVRLFAEQDIPWDDQIKAP